MCSCRALIIRELTLGLRVSISVLFIIATSSQGARILGLFPVPARSHMIVFEPLMTELATRGHQVTVVSAFPLDKPKDNYTDIKLDIPDITKLTSDQGYKIPLTGVNDFKNIINIMKTGLKITELALESNEVQKLIHDEHQHFDLVFILSALNEAFYGFAHKFNASIISICPNIGFPWSLDSVGNKSPSSYVPNWFLSYGYNMTFLQRFYNTVFNLIMSASREISYLPDQNSLMKKHFHHLKNLPTLSDLERKTSLLFLNGCPGVTSAQPLLPNVIQLGGIHIKPTKPLPEDIQDYIESATEGVIFFSMGSIIQGFTLPETTRDAFLKVFSKLKQKVLWKFEEESLPGQPANVKISKWLPQSDILAHPNVRVFISHGGLMSTLEASYHGVPILGIPCFGDQHQNILRVQESGYGLKLDLTNITETSVAWSLDELLYNLRYSSKARQISQVFRDQPQTPMERAVFWTEYVLRHDGAAHMRSSALDLNWYQHLLLDVSAFVIAIVGCSLILIIHILKICLRAILRKSDSHEIKRKYKKYI